MHFGFALELSDIDLWNTDLLDTHLGLLNPEISMQISPVSILFVSISLRVLQDISSRHLQDMSSKGLQDISSRRLEDALEDVKLLRWRRVEDVLKTSSKPTNVCWESLSCEEFRFCWSSMFSVKVPKRVAISFCSCTGLLWLWIIKKLAWSSIAWAIF